ncbi:hypothetical protein FE633_12960 [Streptomyces montanus]|uniref:Uncharacterized protein n=1 Tax=Streptomyces montanus TaxID=2580423 RepID=A0A5R9FP19_9ACTN|nr:hypothetical protein [Streptomyces montanus]TLS45677.1 hypothetical protein FE633_12960 [Streptomyces montanus]
MSSPTTKATAIASMLTTALGAPLDQDDPEAVRIEETDAALRISAPVPPTLSEAVRLGLLDFLLGTADRFGHNVPHDGPSVIWAEIEKADPGGESL